MRTDTEPMLVRVQVITATATPLGEVPVEVVRLERNHSKVVARAVTGGDGIAVLELAPDLWGQRLLARLAGESEQGVVLSRAELDGEVAAVLTVAAADEVDASRFALLADDLVATRRVRADDLANDLAAPCPFRLTHSGVRRTGCGRSSGAPGLGSEGYPACTTVDRVEFQTQGREDPGGPY
jgi:hypothetical protein